MATKTSKPPKATKIAPAHDPASARGQKRRDLIKASTRVVLERVGYRAMKVTDVAAEAQIAVGLFYHYFPDLKTATCEVLSDFLDEMAAAPMAEPKGRYDVIFATDEKGTGDRTFQILQSDFAKIGIRINQRTMDADAAFNAIMAPDGKYQTYDLAMWDWVPPVDPDFMLSVMTCAAWGNNSDSGYCNKEYDALYAKQSTLLDPKARKTVVDKMQQIVYDDRPYVVLNYPNIIEAHSKAWTGFVMSPEVGSVTNLSMETLLNVHRVN